MDRRSAGGFDAQEVCEALPRTYRDRCCRIADFCRSLGSAGHDRILIMPDEDRITRAILTFVWLLAIVPLDSSNHSSSHGTQTAPAAAIPAKRV
jgi:hypothetical protein